LAGDETLLFRASTPDIAAAGVVQYQVEVIKTAITLLSTDRIVVEVLAETTGVAKTAALYYSGSTNYAFVQLPLTGAVLDIAGEINSATAKATPVDADKLGIWNSVTGLLNSLTWANLKATLGSGLEFLTTGLSIKGTSTGKTTLTTANAGASDFIVTLQAKSHTIAAMSDFYIEVACSDVSTALTVGTKKAVFPAPFAFTLTGTFSFLDTVCTGSSFTADLNKNGTSVLSTKLSIDASEPTSLTAATPCVISDSSFAKGDAVSVDFDNVGVTIAGAGFVQVLEITKS